MPIPTTRRSGPAGRWPSVAAGHRVVLVTCTRGEMGEIVVPDMDTPDNHRRLGEIRAGELERAMGALGVTEWENLGYSDSDMMGRAGNRDPRTFWQADLDEAVGRLVLLVRTLPARRHDDLQRLRRLRPPRPHPDPPRRGPRLRPRRRPGLVPGAARPSTAAPGAGGEGGLAPWTPAKLYEQAIPVSVRKAMERAAGGARRAVLLVAAGGRDARADRRVRGLRGEDARPRRGDHDVGRRPRRRSTRANGTRSRRT